MTLRHLYIVGAFWCAGVAIITTAILLSRGISALIDRAFDRRARDRQARHEAAIAHEVERAVRHFEEMT